MPPTPTGARRARRTHGRGLTMRASAALACLALTVALASCSTRDDAEPAGGATTPFETPAPTSPSESADTQTPSPGPSPEAAPSEPVPDLPPFPRGTAPQVDRGPGETSLVLTDVRTAQQDGYGRVVLEFSGGGRPGWAVKYVETAVADGSGEPVTVDGDAVLDIFASGTTYPTDGLYDGPARVTGDGTVADVSVVGTFEGDTQVVAGIDGGRKPFRVFALADPARLVIDVADPQAS